MAKAGTKPKLTPATLRLVLREFHKIPFALKKDGTPGLKRECGAMQVLCDHFHVSHVSVYRWAGLLGKRRKK